jgi:MFS family permease
LYFAGMLTADVAFRITSVAVGWHIFTLHHRAFDLGLVGLVLFIPTFAFALPAGVFSDRHDRRIIVAGAAVLEAASLLAFVVAIHAHVTTLPPYLVILAAIGTARAFGAPAERSLLPSIVAPSEYLRAQATFASLRQFLVVGGPALGGVLVSIGTAFALEISAAAALVGAATLGALRLAPVTHAEPPHWRDAFEGLRFIASRPIIAGAISLDLFAVLFGGATALLPAFADTIFHVGPTGLGAMRSAPALGAAVVAAVIARKPLERRVGITLLIAVTGFGLATIAFGLATNYIAALAFLVIIGGTDMVSVVIRSGLVQLATPNNMRGRVTAVENVFIGASNELGEFESGTLAGFIGVIPAVVAGGVGTLAVIALWGFFFPALRRADRIAETG